jgi:hypothetical protein
VNGPVETSDERRLMITAGLRLLFAALLPLVFIHFELADKTVWAVSSAVCFLVFTAVAIWIARFVREVGVDEDSSRIVHHSVRVLLLASILICLLNATGVVFEQSFGAYFLILMMNFTVAIMFFVRLFHTGMFAEK